MKPGKCKGCGLEGAPGPVWGSGEGKMMLVGEWPRDEGEVIGGVALGGAAGRVLRVACHAAGVDREECYATYAVKCLPGKKGPGKGGRGMVREGVVEGGDGGEESGGGVG